MFDSDFFEYGARSMMDGAVAAVAAVIIGLVAGIVIFIMFMPPKKRSEFLKSPSLLLLHDFLNFRKMIATWLGKLLYIITACILAAISIVTMFSANLFVGLIMLICWQIGLRLVYELLMIIFSIHENLHIIADKVTGRVTETTDISAGEFFEDISSKIKEHREKVYTGSEAPTTVRHCPNCGAANTGGGMFCTGCGQKLE